MQDRLASEFREDHTDQSEGIYTMLTECIHVSATQLVTAGSISPTVLTMDVGQHPADCMPKERLLPSHLPHLR